MKRKINFSVLFGLLIACFLLSSQINTSNVSAYTASITTIDSIELDITPNGNGTSIHSESINVASDCRAGYNLTIATPEGSNLYKYENNTQSSSTASFTAVDGTSALSSDNNTNKWGYTLTSDPNSNTVFSPLSTTASILKTPSQTASPEADINDTFSINYGAKVDNTVEAGTYQMANNGAIVYYLTMDTTCTQYTVSFNPNGGTGAMEDQEMEQGVPTNLAENSFVAPTFGSSYEDADGNTITGAATTYWRFNGWNTAADGTGVAYSEKEAVTDMVGVGSVITLYAQWEALSGMRVNFDTNGMGFEDGSTSNTMGYYHGSKTVYVSYPSYSHTSNVNDDGTQKGNTTYSANLATKDVVSIPGANSLHVTISYGTEDNWDMLYVFKGEYTGSVTRNMSAGQLAKYMGGNNTLTTIELDIPGDTATFAFYSDNSYQYYGYYATVVGYYDTEPESYDSTIELTDRRSLVFGEYSEPIIDDAHAFLGWSENSTAATPDYTSVDDIMNELSGNNGDTKTLYAIWNPRYQIIYVNNCKSYINTENGCTQEISDANSKQIIDLDYSGNGSATLQEFNTAWALSGWKIKGWSTAPDGSGTFYERRSMYNITGAVAGDSVTLYAQWALPYLIQYDGNGADNPNGMGIIDGSTGLKSVKQINIGEGDPITLLTPNFKRAGYGFVGWSIDASATSINGAKIYGPNETIIAPARPINGDDFITMHAIWQKAEEDGDGDPIYLQDFGRTECGNLTQANFDSTTGIISPGSVIALTDKRDDEVYTVARLADGNCWMIDNLRVGAEGTSGQNQNDNTMTNQYLTQGYGGYSGKDTNYGNFIGLAAPETNNFTDNTVANSIYYSGTQSGTATIDIGTSNYPTFRLPRYNDSNTNVMIDGTTFTQDYADLNNISSDGTYNEANLYSLGNYYSWNAAMANTNNYTNSTNSEVTGTSICPSGWSIPSSYGTAKDFGLLSVAYGGSNTSSEMDSQKNITMSRLIRSYPNNFIYAGLYSGRSASRRGIDGMYWTRSAVSGMYVDLFDFSASSFRLGGGYSRFAGIPVRCIINPTKVEIVLDNNNGSGNVNRIYGTPGSSVRLPSYIAAQYGQEFQKWTTAPDGSGSSYTSSYSIPAGSNGVTLYAQWNSQFIVKYVNNCRNYVVNDYCTQSDSDRIDETGITLDASGNGSGKLQSSDVWYVLGWKIVGWNTEADETGTQYAVNDIYSVTNQSAGDNTTLYGVWRKTYKISYDINGGDEGTMGDQALAEDHTAIAESSRVLLLATNYSRSGYGFVGWSTDPDAATNPNAKIYGPHETIIAPAYPENGILKLYAVWVASVGSLQDSTRVAELCGTNGTGGSLVVAPTDGSANISSVSALTDQRDNETYAIARLADGNCWMIENLRLEAENTRSATDEALSQGYGKSLTYGNFVGLADAEFTNVTDLYSPGEPNNLYSSNGSNNTISIGNTDYSSSRMPRYNNLNTPSNSADRPHNPTLNSFARDNTTVGMYSYGNYYTWAAAMASTIHYSGLSATDANDKTSMTANTSICPRGWRLPYSGRGEGGIISGSFSYLDVRLGGTGDTSDDSTNPTGVMMSDKWRAYPNNMLLAGYFNTASANYRGSLGLYWTSGAVSGGSADDIYFTIDYMDPSTSGGRGYANTVRCVMVDP